MPSWPLEIDKNVLCTRMRSPPRPSRSAVKMSAACGSGSQSHARPSHARGSGSRPRGWSRSAPAGIPKFIRDRCLVVSFLDTALPKCWRSRCVVSAGHAALMEPQPMLISWKSNLIVMHAPVSLLPSPCRLASNAIPLPPAPASHCLLPATGSIPFPMSSVASCSKGGTRTCRVAGTADRAATG